MKSKLHPSLVTLTGKYKEHHADYETGIFCYQVKCGEGAITNTITVITNR